MVGGESFVPEDVARSEAYLQEGNIEVKEVLKPENMPVLSIYVLRHGETGKDKTNPKRALTETGEQQVREATINAVKQVIGEAFPDGSELNFDNDEIKEVLSQLKFRLYDSGTTRTQQQIALEKDVLVSLGVKEENIYLPQGYYDYIGSEEKSGPGVAARLEGVQGIDEAAEFRSQISSPDYQAAVGASDEVMAWALTPDEEIPEGVDTFGDVARRVDTNLQSLRHITPRLAQNGQRMVILANSHASNVTIAAARVLGVEDPRQLGQADNAEGVRLAVYQDGTQKAEPFGANYENKMETRE